MTLFSQLTVLGQHLVTDLFFLTLPAQLALCIYQRVCHGRGKRIVFDGVWLAAVLCVCCWVSAASNGAFRLDVPWLLFPVAALAEGAHVALAIRREYRIHRTTLTSDSIKQTLDNLNSGILFADAQGRTVVLNYKMANTFFAWQNLYPQMVQEIDRALETAPQVSDKPTLHRLPDGRVWRFRTVPLHDPELPGFTQTTAQDMTELFAVNEQLAAENDALRAAIARMTDMLGQVEERVREEETLHIRMRVHNDIGRSLISIASLMENMDRAPDEQVRILHQAVRLFSTGAPEEPLTLENVARESAELGVSMKIVGDAPENTRVMRLIAAAARECVTNCVRHAGGRQVTVHIRREASVTTAVITNDGAVPKAPIREGGGLSNLRELIENAGGQMVLTHSPAFALTLILNEKELIP